MWVGLGQRVLISSTLDLEAYSELEEGRGVLGLAGAQLQLVTELAQPEVRAVERVGR
jgi:hypothetical protein